MDRYDLSEPQAMRFAAARVAPYLVKLVEEEKAETPGQIAEFLSEWQQLLGLACKTKYQLLTAGYEGPVLDRKAANADTELVTLQAIRRGVRDAMKLGYKAAPGQITAWPDAVASVNTVRQWRPTHTEA